MSMIFASPDSRKVTIAIDEVVVKVDLLATAISCIADLVGHIQGRIMQQEERIAVDVAKQVMTALMGE